MIFDTVALLLTLLCLGHCDDTSDQADHVWSPDTTFHDKDLDHSTLLLSQHEANDKLHNNPLDNLSDLRDIHQFDIDLSNYTDHQAVETGQDVLNQFIDHFDILPGMDTRDFNDTEFYSSEVEEQPSNHLQNLSPELYEVVTSLPEEHESRPYDKNHLDNDHYDGDDESHEGMDGKYYTLLENIHKKFHDIHKDDDMIEEEEVHDEENDVLHPLISLTAIKPNSMRLAITPKKFSKDSMVRLMYKRVPRNKPALMQHLDDPIIEYIKLYRVDQEHFLFNLPMGKYIVCADYSINSVVVQHNCFETMVDRLDTNELQGGVVGIIALAILTLVSCMGYAIYHRCIKEKDQVADEEMMEAKPTVK